MKKNALILCTAVTLLAACSGSDADIRRPATRYVQALADYDLAAAYPYATRETQLYTLDYFRVSLMAHLDPAIIAAATPATIDIDSVVRHTDTTATVHYSKTTPQGRMPGLKVDMRLRDGQWLAHQVVQAAPMLPRLVNPPSDSTARPADSTAMQRHLDSLRPAPAPAPARLRQSAPPKE